MKWWRTICAALLLLAVMIIQHSEHERLQLAVKSMMHSAHDVFFLREIVQQQLQHAPSGLITASASDLQVKMLGAYEQGYILHTADGPVIATENNFILFTGFVKNKGRTMTIQFNNDITITYSLIDEFMQMPYRFVLPGEVLFYNEGSLYIQIEQNRQRLNEQETLAIFRVLHE